MRFLDLLWYNPYFKPLAWLLSPFSAIFVVWTKQRKKRQCAVQHLFNKPVVIVGNITVGGTGKTPVLIALARFLMEQGIKVGVVSRGYKSQAEIAAHPLIVGDEVRVEDIGDEAYMMYRELQCPMVVHGDRVAAVQSLLEKFSVDVVLSDDGLQHYTMGRTIEIVVVDGQRQFGNHFCLPAGPLREPLFRLKTVDFILVNQGNVQGFFQDFQVPAYAFSIRPEDVIKVDGTRAIVPLTFLRHLECDAVAGIAHPERFFKTLYDLGARVHHQHIFSDHYAFQAKDFKAFSRFPIVMTQKDAVKCEHLGLDNAYALEIAADLPEDFLRAFLSKLGYNFQDIKAV